MKLIISLLFSFSVAGFPLSKVQRPSELEDAAVYATYLNSIDENANNGKAVKLIVVNKRVKPLKDYCNESNVFTYSKKISKQEFSLLLKDLRAKPAGQKQFESLSGVKNNYVLLDEKDFRLFFDTKQPDGWEAFYQRYPDSSGYISLSGVGYNAAGTKAIIFRAEACGSLYGSGDFIIFQKVNDKWEIAEKPNCWIS